MNQEQFKQEIESVFNEVDGEYKKPLSMGLDVGDGRDPNENPIVHFKFSGLANGAYIEIDAAHFAPQQTTLWNVGPNRYCNSLMEALQVTADNYEYEIRYHKNLIESREQLVNMIRGLERANE